MKTQLICGTLLIKEYDFLLTMPEGSMVEKNGIEYTTGINYLHIDKDIMEIECIMD